MPTSALYPPRPTRRRSPSRRGSAASPRRKDRSRPAPLRARARVSPAVSPVRSSCESTTDDSGAPERARWLRRAAYDRAERFRAFPETRRDLSAATPPPSPGTSPARTNASPSVRSGAETSAQFYFFSRRRRPPRLFGSARSRDRARGSTPRRPGNPPTPRARREAPPRRAPPRAARPGSPRPARPPTPPARLSRRGRWRTVPPGAPAPDAPCLSRSRAARREGPGRRARRRHRAGVTNRPGFFNRVSPRVTRGARSPAAQPRARRRARSASPAARRGRRRPAARRAAARRRRAPP